MEPLVRPGPRRPGTVARGGLRAAGNAPGENQNARLIAVPGCYPTSVQLGYLPLLEAGLIDPGQLIADCKSGVTGAGRGAKVGSLLAEASESMKAYGASGHRHLPEISQGLKDIQQSAVGLTFVPT